MVCANEPALVLQMQDNNDRVEVLLARYEADLGFVMAVVADRFVREIEMEEAPNDTRI